MATIVCSSRTVIEAATKTIAHIEAERAKFGEESIAKVRAKKRGWFKRYNPSRELAIKILDNSMDFGMGWRSHYAWGDLNKAKSLLLIAKHGDPVTLDQNDARVIF